MVKEDIETFNYELMEKRFNGLRKRCQRIKIENRKMLETMSKPRVYQLESEEHDPTESGTVDDEEEELLKLLNTSLRDMESKYGRNKDKTITTLQGDQIAKSTYDKELKLVSKIKYQHRNDNFGNVDAMVENLNQTSKKRYMVRKTQINASKMNENDTSNGAYINVKNKQFNDKLNRERGV